VQKKIVEGYPATMPTFKGLLKENEIDAIIAYLKTVQ
jgi:cytochrome c oxidase subunit 2